MTYWGYVSFIMISFLFILMVVTYEMDDTESIFEICKRNNLQYRSSPDQCVEIKGDRIIKSYDIVRVQGKYYLEEMK